MHNREKEGGVLSVGLEGNHREDQRDARVCSKHRHDMSAGWVDGGAPDLFDHHKMFATPGVKDGVRKIKP